MARIKVKEHEKLDDENIAQVIALLEAAKPITKKQAYERLNIAANSARLQKIIDDYKERKARDERFRAEKRGTPATPQEIQEVIRGYLDGDSITSIADGLYRPANFVKNIIEKVGVPARNSGDYFHPDLLPEQCVRDSFEEGQIVWSARYQALAIIIKERPSNSEYKVYQIYVIEAIEEVSPYFPHLDGYGGRYADQAAFDLGSLEHLKEHGVDVYKPFRAYFQNMLKGR